MNDSNSRSAGMSSTTKHHTSPKGTASGCCDIDISIHCEGNVNVYNCSAPSGTGTTAPPSECDNCFPPVGACLPAVPGAKHKLGRDYKISKLADRVPVPSSLAAGVVHMMRRFLLGKAAGSPIEKAAFATLGKMSRGLLSCTLSAFDAIPPGKRIRLFSPVLNLNPDTPLDAGILATALAQEIKQRMGVIVFGDPQGPDQERPGKIRVYEPQGEDFFSQVRICRINDLRTANFIPPVAPGDYVPAELQQDCTPQVVDGQPQVVCQLRTSDCPGNSLGTACTRVPDVQFGDGVVLDGVNYFSIDAKVRLTDKLTGNPVRDVDAFVRGDIDTPVTEVVNGATVLINDCRVHDQLTFQVPNDLAPGVYQIQVVVPNVTGVASLGPEMISNAEFINIVPPPTARFQIVLERVRAREETSPAWLGSDEVGLHTLAFPLFTDGTFGTGAPDVLEQKFTDLQNVDFDSGTSRNPNTVVFQHSRPILGMAMSVRGDEIDSQGAYDDEVRSSADFFYDLIKKEAEILGSALVLLGGISALTKLGVVGAIIAGIALAVTLGIDLIVALWAPADPIIRDVIGLTVSDLAALTSANAPAPDPTTFNTEDDIVVNVNKTIPPLKLPLEYHETREYVSDDQDSRYEITYRYNHIA
jgi:hypothetical protein